MKSIQQEYTIKAPVSLVWKALTDSKVINQWGAGPARMSDAEGFKFSLWGGDIYGTNTKVIKEKELVQDWVSGNWEKPSVVTFLLEQKDDQTLLILYHKNIPDSDAKDIEEGWKKYYVGPLKELLEK